MVVHRGSSWDASPDTSHRSSLQASNTSNRSTLQTIYQNSSSAQNDASSRSKRSSSDDQPLLVQSKNPFNMRQVILNNLSSGHRPNSHAFIRHTYSPFTRLRGRPITNAAKSLDILRQNLQSSINKEIDAVLKKYLEKFFRPAIDNVRTNLGPGSVSEEHVREVCRTVLEEARQMYCGPLSRGSSPFSDCETTSLIESRLRRTQSQASNNKTQKDDNLLSPTQPCALYSFEEVLQRTKNQERLSSFCVLLPVNFVSQSLLMRKRKESDTDSETSQTALRKRVPRPRVSSDKWDPSRLTKDTHFILGSRANKVLGLGHVLGKGRLYVKHPQLFKYCSDQQDREWLASHRHTLINLASSKVYIMLLDEIKELINSDEYRNSPTVLVHELKGFEAPDFMLQKIKKYMNHIKPQPPEDSESPSDTSPGAPSNLSVECVSSTMTPPATVLDSGPSTPSEALDLLDPPTYLSLPGDQQRQESLSALLSAPPADQARG